MGTESEIYRTANLLIQEYGDMGPPAAFIRADQLYQPAKIIIDRPNLVTRLTLFSKADR